MKQTVLTALIGLLALSSCGNVNPPQTPAFQAQAPTPAKDLLQASLYCPPTLKIPYWHPCGKTSLRVALSGGPGMGGNIIPADFLFTGSAELFSALGKSFTATLPVSGNSKFYINNVLLVVDTMDSTVAETKAEFNLQSITQEDQSNHNFTYYGEIQTLK